METSYICKFCGKSCKNENSQMNHERLCPKNPDRKYVSHTIGRKAWNKGLTKSTDERVAKIAKTQSVKYSGKSSHWYGKHHTEDTIEKMKQSCGGYRRGSGLGKSGWYKGYFCDSSWELAYVIYNLEHGIKFERNREKFRYIFEGKEHNYLPDFIVDGKYVEVKGYWTKKWQAKYDQFPRELSIIGKEEIKPYLEYVENKYGRDFIKLYE